MKIVNVGDWWTAKLFGRVLLVEVVQNWVEYTHVLTEQDKENWKGMGYTPEETPHTVWQTEDSGWMYRSFRTGMQDVMRDPNAMVSIRWVDAEGLDNFMKTSTNVLMERVPNPEDEEEPWMEDEPASNTAVVLGGVALLAVMFWDEAALIFLATR